jgi:adenine-specific DNA-methyltransferase
MKEENKDSNTKDLEQNLDNLVYRLYDLTWEEVRVIDPDFGLSEEEYKKIEIQA